MINIFSLTNLLNDERRFVPPEPVSVVREAHTGRKWEHTFRDAAIQQQHTTK